MKTRMSFCRDLYKKMHLPQEKFKITRELIQVLEIYLRTKKVTKYRVNKRFLCHSHINKYKIIYFAKNCETYLKLYKI